MNVIYYLVRGKTSLPKAKRHVKREFPVGVVFIERVSEKKASWPVLGEAIKKVQSLNCPLEIINVGKLVRSPTFLRPLRDSGIKFDCVDSVLCDRNVAQHYAVASEWVRHLANAMRDTMSQSKAKFGFAASPHRSDPRCVRGALKGPKVAAKARTERARRAYAVIVPKIETMRTEGLTWDEIVERLNQDEHRSTTGEVLNRPTVIRIYQRAMGIKPRRRDAT